MFSKDQQEQNAALLDMDIQREEIAEFFRDYWKQILGIAVFLVLLTGALEIYRWVDMRTAADQTAAMLPLIEAPGTAENAKALEQFAKEKATGNRRAVALLFAAAKYQTADKPDDRQRVLADITNSGAPDAIRDYARVLRADAGDPAAALDSIAKTSPWQYAVRELRALAATDPQKRRDGYGEIASDAKAPPALRARAAEFSGQSAAE